jgi:hypothetical protein
MNEAKRLRERAWGRYGRKPFDVPVTGEVSGVSAKRAGITVYGSSLQVEGVTLPAILCDVRMTSVGIRGFVRVCQKYAISIRPAGSGEIAVVPDRETVEGDCERTARNAWECIGNADALEYLAGHPSVVRWSLLDRTANAVDCRAAGAGKPK